MIILFFLIPLLAVFSSIALFGYNGRREFLKLDFTQFFYAFILSPILFIWGKSFLFFLLRNELDLNLSLGEIFLLDSAFSAVFLYVFAFVVIHSLTKTFHLKRTKDPLYDMFEHSEFYHQELSHLAIYAGGMLLITLLSVVNLFVPLVIEHIKWQFYLILVSGTVTGALTFLGIWLFEATDPSFMRLMKLCFGFFFLVHVTLYFVLDPAFNAHYGFYWAIFMSFLTTVIISLFAERPEKKKGVLDRIPLQLNWRKSYYYYLFIRKKITEMIS